eukprot:jgi/Bigna1/80758/fgenesh1_pg.74_\
MMHIQAPLLIKPQATSARSRRSSIRIAVGFLAAAAHISPAYASKEDQIESITSAIAGPANGLEGGGVEKRQMFVAGNWKMNPGTVTEAESLASLVGAAAIALQRDRPDLPSIRIGVTPPSPFLPVVASILKGTGVKVGAQDLHWEGRCGAHTGGVAASMLKSAGASFVLCGHSERRSIFKETDEEINLKVKAALTQDLDVVLCIGETFEEFQADLVESVCTTQLAKGLAGVSTREVVQHLTIAYEPVWAIGTGLTATPEIAQAVHKVIRTWLENQYGKEAASYISIQYGGSVTPETSSELLQMPDIDGALVGGASLSADKFNNIVSSAALEAGVKQGVSPALTKSVLPIVAVDDKRRAWRGANEVWDAVEEVKKLTVASEEVTQKLEKAKDTLKKIAEEKGGATYLKAEELVPCRNDLGESPVWSARENKLYWVDIQVKNTGEGEIDAQHGWMCCLERGRISDWSEATYEGLDTRPNDGRCDRNGNLIVGSYNFQHKFNAQEIGSLYRLDSEGGLRKILNTKHRVSNCISFTPDGKGMYFCDTPTRRIFKFKYDATADGSPLSEPILFKELPNEMAGMPDGANTDSEGGIWVAITGGEKVIRISPEGNIDVVVDVKGHNPTSVTIGGSNLGQIMFIVVDTTTNIYLDTLFITTRGGPEQGSLLGVKLPVSITARGIPEATYMDKIHAKSSDSTEITAAEEKNDAEVVSKSKANVAVETQEEVKTAKKERKEEVKAEKKEEVKATKAEKKEEVKATKAEKKEEVKTEKKEEVKAEKKDEAKAEKKEDVKAGKAEKKDEVKSEMKDEAKAEKAEKKEEIKAEKKEEVKAEKKEEVKATKAEKKEEVKAEKKAEVKAEKKEEVKAEKKEEVKAEKKEEVKAEKKEDVKAVKAEKKDEAKAEKKDEVKAEKKEEVKAEKKEEVKAEKKEEVKAEKKEEVKVEKKEEVKAEKKEEVKAEKKEEVKAEKKEEVKTEKKEEVKAVKAEKKEEVKAVKAEKKEEVKAAKAEKQEEVKAEKKEDIKAEKKEKDEIPMQKVVYRNGRIGFIPLFDIASKATNAKKAKIGDQKEVSKVVDSSSEKKVESDAVEPTLSELKEDLSESNTVDTSDGNGSSSSSSNSMTATAAMAANFLLHLQRNGNKF